MAGRIMCKKQPIHKISIIICFKPAIILIFKKNNSDLNVFLIFMSEITQ